MWLSVGQPDFQPLLRTLGMAMSLRCNYLVLYLQQLCYHTMENNVEQIHIDYGIGLFTY